MQHLELVDSRTPGVFFKGCASYVSKSLPAALLQVGLAPTVAAALTVPPGRFWLTGSRHTVASVGYTPSSRNTCHGLLPGAGLAEEQVVLGREASRWRWQVFVHGNTFEHRPGSAGDRRTLRAPYWKWCLLAPLWMSLDQKLVITDFSQLQDIEAGSRWKGRVRREEGCLYIESCFLSGGKDFIFLA